MVVIFTHTFTKTVLNGREKKKKKREKKRKKREKQRDRERQREEDKLTFCKTLLSCTWFSMRHILAMLSKNLGEYKDSGGICVKCSTKRTSEPSLLLKPIMTSMSPMPLSCTYCSSWTSSFSWPGRNSPAERDGMSKCLKVFTGIANTPKHNLQSPLLQDTLVVCTGFHCGHLLSFPKVSKAVLLDWPTKW